jgi:nucleoside-diphosphate-sugar epimerase
MTDTQQKTVLITGGAGFLGINLVRFFLKKGGYRIRALDIAPFKYPERDQIKVIDGDVRDKATVDRAMNGVDLVVHGAMALPLYPKHDILTTGIDGTRIVLQSALDHKIPRVIHISSTAVYGIPDHHPLVEGDKLDGVGPYGVAKVAAEEICAEFRAKGLCVPIIRPKSFVGPERLGIFVLLYDWAATGHNFPMIGNGKNRYQLLDVEDLCEAIYLAATGDAKKVNDTFNIGAEKFKTMGEEYQAVLDKAGFGKRVIGFPAQLLIWPLRILDWFRLAPVYKWVYETASKDSFVSIEKAQRVLGYSPRYSNTDALRRNYEWYLKNQSQFSGKSGVTHRLPWKQGLLSVAKLFF